MISHIIGISGEEKFPKFSKFLCDHMIRIQDGGGFGSLFSFPEHTPAELLPAPGAGRPWPWPGAVAGAGS